MKVRLIDKLTEIIESPGPISPEEAFSAVLEVLRELEKQNTNIIRSEKRVNQFIFALSDELIELKRETNQ